ncbi:MAG TPA: hypothetical protein VM370_01630 [Candidatus Thermoplasmatota archaeon]|nr:hypothetical protein [Candidatus Thermoplasmatota archaeon]
MDETKPQTEVLQESRETLSVLELDRKPRPEKMASERAYFDGAHEVRFTERTFRPKHGAGLDDIRGFVDSLEIRRREIPPLPVVESAPVVVAPRIPDHYRAPLERVIRGALVSVETVHRVGTGTVVDVAWEAEDEGERRGLYLIEDDAARPYSDVAATIDALDAPRKPVDKKADGPSPPAPGPASQPAERKRRFGFGKK